MSLQEMLWDVHDAARCDGDDNREEFVERNYMTDQDLLVQVEVVIDFLHEAKTKTQVVRILRAALANPDMRMGATWWLETLRIEYSNGSMSKDDPNASSMDATIRGTSNGTVRAQHRDAAEILAKVRA